MCSVFLCGCSTVTIPQVGGRVPCQLQLTSQVEQAIYTALNEEGWKVVAAEDHWIEVQKKSSQMQATVEIAYGYRGFSIEYRESENMNYDPDNDTIGRAYVKWVAHLRNDINDALQKEAELNASVPCSDKNNLDS